mgnify:CR=1 FL=1
MKAISKAAAKKLVQLLDFYELKMIAFFYKLG